VERVRKYSLEIGRRLGIAGDELREIEIGAVLHDVGKIYDTYAPILPKEARLSPEEWAIIKEHPVDGANLIATMTRRIESAH